MNNAAKFEAQWLEIVNESDDMPLIKMAICTALARVAESRMPDDAVAYFPSVTHITHDGIEPRGMLMCWKHQQWTLYADIDVDTEDYWTTIEVYHETSPTQKQIVSLYLGTQVGAELLSWVLKGIYTQ